MFENSGRHPNWQKDAETVIEAKTFSLSQRRGENAMTAFFVATAAVLDNGKFQEYGAKVRETLTDFGGEPVLRGKAEGALVGAVNHQVVGIVKFPEMTALNSWYESEAYQALIPLRNEAADFAIVKYEQLS